MSLLQNSRSSGNVPAAASSEYSKSQLEASAAQKDNFFARKLEVGHSASSANFSSHLITLVDSPCSKLILNGMSSARLLFCQGRPGKIALILHDSIVWARKYLGSARRWPGAKPAISSHSLCQHSFDGFRGQQVIRMSLIHLCQN